MKKPFNEKLVSLMSLTLFALLLAEAYLKHKDDIDESVSRLKAVLNQGSPEEKTAEESVESEVTEEGANDNAE